MWARYVWSVVLVLCMVAAPVSGVRGQGETKQKGISYSTWWQGRYASADGDLALADISATGANWVALLTTRYQDTITSTVLYATPRTPTDADLIHAAASAHDLGLKVTLKLHIDLEHRSDYWRADIGLGFTEQQWAAWFESYEQYVSHYARLAQDQAVEQIVIGTELRGTETRAAEWRALIARMRLLYAGSIVYASNFDWEGQGTPRVTWWDAVDYIGIDAYYPLATTMQPTLAELRAAWRPRVDQLAALSSQWSTPILFTEIGYRSVDGAATQPWDAWEPGPLDLDEQALLYQALLESFFHEPWFAGVYWWNWWPDPYDGGPCDIGFSPNDKPAEEVIRAWYGGQPVPAVAEPVANDAAQVTVFSDAVMPGWNAIARAGALEQVEVAGAPALGRVISATLAGWGTLTLHHSGFDTGPYHWLSTTVRLADPNPDLGVIALNAGGARLRQRPLSDCRYTALEPVQHLWSRAC